MTTAAKAAKTTKTTTNLDEILNSAVRSKTEGRSKTAAKQETAEFANIEANTFIQIVYHERLTLDEKREAVEKALTGVGTKEEIRARVREFEEMKEYMQHQRSEMAQEIIRLTDTETFSELKRIYDDLQGALLDFDEKMTPLTDIISAVYTLRTNGEAGNAFKEIQDDRIAEAARQAKRAEEETAARELLDQQMRIRQDIAREQERKSFFGLGGIKADAKVRIAELESQMSSSGGELQTVRDRINAIDSEARAARNKEGNFAAEKAKLRELLDITGEQHKSRQEDLVKAALNFVDTARDRIGAVRGHLGKMNSQIDNLVEANGGMTQVYAILNEGVKGATRNNQELRNTLAVAPEGEDLLKKMTREEKLSDLDGHIKLLDTSSVDTMASYADITSQTVRIRAMKDSNDDQIAKARSLHANGVAGVADRLNVALQAVSAAAINESAAMARDTLAMMTDSTNKIAQKEVIRVASGMSERNAELERSLESLSDYGKVLAAGTSMVKEAVQDGRRIMGELEKGIHETADRIRDHEGAYSDEALAPAQEGTAARAPGVRLPKFGA